MANLIHVSFPLTELQSYLVLAGLILLNAGIYGVVIQSLLRMRGGK